MDVYVARQPIFDRERHLYGYELLYRKEGRNYFPGGDDRQATAALLANSVLVANFSELTDGTKGFINFPGEFLIEGLPRLLPRRKIVVEVLERVQATSDVIAACRRLKQEGYTIALDDFLIRGERVYHPLVQLADIVKIEFSKNRLTDQLQFMRRFRGKIIFLAEKIETEKEYELARKMGYRLFQGYFFSRPAMINATDIGLLDIRLINIIKDLRKPEPDLDQVAAQISKDLGLTYKVLRLSNRFGFGAMQPVHTIRQAVVRIGTEQLLQWLHLFLLNQTRNRENDELVKTSMIRGRLMQLLAGALGRGQQAGDYFITGIFSSIDFILNDSMKHIIDELPLDGPVRSALLGGSGPLRETLESVKAYEAAKWEQLRVFIQNSGIDPGKYITLYLSALQWTRSIDRGTD
ncbi:MAG: HDOD domain-containing protein [Sporolactobacillus sp.]|nr:HDOD domain-containing protein [Sporolactobacillus sp.]